MSFELNDQVAIVTGASRGIGRETAIRLARNGAAVILASRSCQQLRDLADAIAAQGGTAVPLCTDVTDADSVKRTVSRTYERFGRIDILVNNAAGANYISSLALSDDARWKQIFDVNVFGVYQCTKAALPHMIRAKKGRIINISSVAGQAGAAYNSAYSASKAAVIGFTKAIALEVAGLGITSNAICPWHVDTEMMRDAMSSRGSMFGETTDKYIAKIVGSSPQKRLITAEEVAGLVVFLSCAEARGINGQALSQCGGFLTG
jgi:NAD(P)-dependent dehydrogenase (short-subunit alcohol dehydrogenase family)